MLNSEPKLRKVWAPYTGLSETKHQTELTITAQLANFSQMPNDNESSISTKMAAHDNKIEPNDLIEI